MLGRFDNLESRSFQANVIVIRNQVSYVVVAGFVAGGLKFGVFLDRSYGQSRANHRSSGLICDGAEDASVDSLSACGSGNKSKQTQEDQDRNCRNPEIWRGRG